MNSSNAGNHLFLAQIEVPDPGASGTIVPDVSLGVCNLVSATAETRTLAAPLKAGVFLTLYHRTDGGDITLTITGGYDQVGTTSWTFSAAGQYLFLQSFYNGSAYVWRKMADYASGLVTPADQAVLQEFSNLTASVPELNRAADDDVSVETVAAIRVLTAADSRKTLFLAHATEFDTKLPAPAAGLRFLFIVGLAPSGANYTITTDGTTQNVIHGIISSGEDALGAGAGTNGTPVDVVTFVASKAQVGDWVEVICDGTLWYLRGACYQQDAITLS